MAPFRQFKRNISSEFKTRNNFFSVMNQLMGFEFHQRYVHNILCVCLEQGNLISTFKSIMIMKLCNMILFQ